MYVFCAVQKKKFKKIFFFLKNNWRIEIEKQEEEKEVVFDENKFCKLDERSEKSVVVNFRKKKRKREREN